MTFGSLAGQQSFALHEKTCCYKVLQLHFFIIAVPTTMGKFVSHQQLHMISGKLPQFSNEEKSNIRKQHSVFLAVLNANYSLEIRKKVL